MILPSHTRVYRGKVACPQCDSLQTGTSTIATSERYIVFQCDSCRHAFRVLASKVSSLSKTLNKGVSA
jgi:transcription elongation factor Elf1